MDSVELFIDWLDDYLNFEKAPQKNIFWLETIDYLCKRFDNPQDSSPSFHVAGSKGKGSVSKMIACILEAAGYKTGLYSSPHILNFRERISLSSGFLPENIYEDTSKEIVPKIESIIPTDLPGGRQLTWFEIVTLYGFMCFKNAKVDWSVYEVGLGGRLDATNIIRPKLCCITPIELEHTEFLGNTLEKIAFEKAGIIKNNTPVLIARQQTPEVKEVFLNQAKSKYAPCYFIDDLIDDLTYELNPETKKMKLHMESSIFNRNIETELQLVGSKQAENAALAAVAIKKIFPNMDESIIEQGLAKAKLPARFEIQDFIIFDGAHTLNSISLTISTLNSLFQETKTNLLFACAADKDIKDMSLLFKDRFEHVYITRPGSQKKSDINSEIQAFTHAKIKFTADPDYEKIIRKAIIDSKENNAHLLVTGSFYLIAEVKKILLKHPELLA